MVKSLLLKDIEKALNIKSDSRIYNLPMSEMKSKIEKSKVLKMLK